jgi:hypothetical protein
MNLEEAADEVVVVVVVIRLARPDIFASEPRNNTTGGKLYIIIFGTNDPVETPAVKQPTTSLPV